MLFVASPNPACDHLSAGRYEPQYDNCYPRGDEYDDDQSSSNNDDVVGDCLILTDAVGGDNIDDLTSTTQYLQQPSLLMSSVLLESLPLPIPSDDVAYDDPLALFTRRMQKYHATNLTRALSRTRGLRRRMRMSCTPGRRAGARDNRRKYSSFWGWLFGPSIIPPKSMTNEMAAAS